MQQTANVEIYSGAKQWSVAPDVFRALLGNAIDRATFVSFRIVVSGAFAWPDDRPREVPRLSVAHKIQLQQHTRELHINA